MLLRVASFSGALAVLCLATCSNEPSSQPPPPGPYDAGSGGGLPDGSPPDGSVGGNGGTDAGTDAGGEWPAGFTPTPTNVPDGYLCDIPDDYVQTGGDVVNPPCELESDSFSDRDRYDVPAELKIVTWNVEWGKHGAEVLGAFATDPGLVDADILMLQEVPRYDNEGDPPNINLARELAQQQQMNYVYGVEWDRRKNADQGGEHGLSILAKYPIGNALLIRHTPCYDHYSDKGHYGGRATLAVDLVLGDERVRVYDAHLGTRDIDGDCRALQGDEILADAHLPGQPGTQLLGGDMNTFICTPMLELCNDPAYAEGVIRNLLADGWLDLLPTFTSWTQLGLGLLQQRLDWLFAKQVNPVSFAVLQHILVADHVPVTATFGLP